MKRLLSILALVIALCGCARKAAFDREYADLIREATSPREKLLHSLEYQLLCYAEKNEFHRHFVLSDGIDQLEAWMLAKIFMIDSIGACSDVEPPEMIADEWMIRYREARAGKDGAPIRVDAKSGRLTCDGHAAIENPIDFLIKFESRFEAPRSAR